MRRERLFIWTLVLELLAAAIAWGTDVLRNPRDGDIFTPICLMSIAAIIGGFLLFYLSHLLAGRSGWLLWRLGTAMIIVGFNLVLFVWSEPDGLESVVAAVIGVSVLGGAIFCGIPLVAYKLLRRHPTVHNTIVGGVIISEAVFFAEFRGGESLRALIGGCAFCLAIWLAAAAEARRWVYGLIAGLLIAGVVGEAINKWAYSGIGQVPLQPLTAVAGILFFDLAIVLPLLVKSDGRRLMERARLLSWTLWIALGIASSGAIAAQFANGEQVGTEWSQLTELLCSAPVFSALLLASAWRWTEPAARAAPLAASGLTVFGAVLALLYLSPYFRYLNLARSGPSQFELLLGTAPIGLVMAVLSRDARFRMACRVGLVSLAAWIIYVRIDITGLSSWVNDHEWLIPPLGYGGVLLTLNLIGAGTDQRHWRWAGVFCSLAAITALFWWGADPNYRTPAKYTLAYIWFFVFGLAFAQANVVAQLSLTRTARLLAAATVLIVLPIGYGVWQMLFTDIYRGHVDGLMSDRWTAVESIAYACGTMAVLLIASEEYFYRRVEVGDDFEQFDL